jgi:hypothetical protein
MPFTCSICEEESTRICVQCTKDSCSNHLCDKCGCCSDCCDCEVPLDDSMHVETVHPAPVEAAATEAAVEPVAELPPDPEPQPEPPHPSPDPDPVPGEGPEPEPEP